MTTRSIDDLAREIVDLLITDGTPRDVAMLTVKLNELVPHGHALTRDGVYVVTRKVLGELQCTADNAIAAEGAKVHHPKSVVESGRFVVDGYVDVPTHIGADGFIDQSEDYAVSECYSTRELALAAKQPAPTKGPNDA